MNDDIIRNLNFLECAIFERLSEWNRGAGRKDAEGRLVHWIPPDHFDAFASLFRNFCRLQKASPGSASFRFLKHSPVDLYDKLIGWECGLYQVLDISKKDICRALPILLTAYCYNYARGGISFIENFPKEEIPSSWLSQNSLQPNRYYIGAEFDDDDFPWNSAKESNNKAGIGRLLNGYEQTSTQVLRNYAKSFFFGDLEIVQTFIDFKTYKNIDAEYIIPSRGRSIFLKNVHRKPAGIGRSESIKWERYEGDRFEFVVGELRELGFNWMLASYLAASDNIKAAEERNEKPDFACEPDLYSCYCYLLAVLKSDGELKIAEAKYNHLDESRRNIAISRALKKELGL